MEFNFSQETPLFHGSKSDFKKFNLQYVGTGENAGPGVGMHLTDSLKGAAAHADRYVRGDGEPLVYVCKVIKGANVMRRGVAPSKHPQAVQKIWQEKLTVACSQLFEESSWFDELGKCFSPLLVINCPTDKSEAKKCHFLQQAGIDLLTNYEVGWQDAYLLGDVILLLNPSMIEIVECLPVDKIRQEIIGDPKKYILANSKSLLGETMALSYLRQAS